MNRSELVRHLLVQLALRAGDWRDSGGVSAALADSYRARSVTIGSRVRALLPGGREVVGTAVSIDRHGRLSIDTGADAATIAAGDIVHLRPLDRPPSG